MEKIGIVTEETADLPQEIIEKHQLAIVPIQLDWPEIKELPGENTFQKMRELEKRGIKSFGKTSQPSPNDFLEKYNFQLDKFDRVLCITLASTLSGSHNSAMLAKTLLAPDNQERVFIVDSLNGTCGQGLIVLKAIELIKSGKKIEEIVRELEEFVPQVHLFIMFDDPKWIEATGRLSSFIANLMRVMARIGVRPLLALKKGVLVPAGLKTRAKEIPVVLFRQLEKETKIPRKAGNKIRVAITHGDALKAALLIKEMTESKLENTEVAFINIIDNPIGAPIGPNSLACAWCEV